MMTLSGTPQGKLVTQLTLDNLGPVHSICHVWNLSMFGALPLFPTPSPQIVGLYLLCILVFSRLKISILWDCVVRSASTRSEQNR